MSDAVWIDGEVVEASEARVPVFDHGLLYGDGVFEGIRVHGGRVFRLDDHLERLRASAAGIGLEPGHDRAALRDVVLRTVRASGYDDAYVRLLVTRGDGPLGVDPTRCTHPRVICIVARLEIFDPERRRRGLDLITSSVRRDPAGAVDPRLKTLNYLGSVLAKREAVLAGADDALLLNPSGAVAEASVGNVFAFVDGRLCTPPATDGALGGITRDTLIEAAGALGIPVREASLGRVDLLRAQEAFMSGTGAGVVGIRSLDGVQISLERPVCEKLGRAYAERVACEGVPVR